MAHGPEVDYAIMRNALEMFDTTQAELNDGQRTEVLHRVNRELGIARKLLQSPEASGVVVTEASVEQAYDELAQRFEDSGGFVAALKANNLDEDKLKQALVWQLRLDMVLEHLLTEQSSVSEEEIEIYYYEHLEKFALPETRTARHILITINDEYPENRREIVTQRMEALAEQLHNDPASFHQLAGQHSECPTAMHEGLLGRIKRGQLYQQLDEALFSMEAGAISPIIETEVGLHILLCDTIHPAGKLPFAEVKEKLRGHLEQKKRKTLLHTWLRTGA